MEEKKTREQIEDELISKDLTEYIKMLFALLVPCSLFGFLGYQLSLDLGDDVIGGIVAGAVFPLGAMLLSAIKIDGWGVYVLYAVSYIIITEFIPIWIGFTILFVIIFFYIVLFIYIEQRDRTEDISGYDKKDSVSRKNTVIIKKHNSYIPKYTYNNSKIVDKFKENHFNDDFLDEYSDDYDYGKYDNWDEEIYECGICFKKISEEEYELNDCMCEECFIELHTDKNGHFYDKPF